MQVLQKNCTTACFRQIKLKSTVPFDLAGMLLYNMSMIIKHTPAKSVA